MRPEHVYGDKEGMIHNRSADEVLAQLKEVAQLVINEPDMDSLSRQLAQLVARLLDAAQVFVAVMGKGQLAVSQVFQDGRFHSHPLAIPPGAEIAGWVMTHLRPYRSPDSHPNPPTISATFARYFPCDVVLAVPILNHQRHVLGVIECHRPSGAPYFGDHALQLAQTIALIAASGMERAKLLGGMQNWAQSFQNLLAFSAALNEQKDTETLMRRLVENAAGFIGAKAGWAGLVEEQTIRGHSYWHNGRWQPFTAEWRPNEGLPGWVFSHQWPYMTNDYPADTMADARLTAVFPIHNAICIPILGADNEVLGFVELHNKQDGRDPFTWSDVTFMTSLANTTAVALQNTRLLNQLETQRAQLQALSAQQMTLLEEERQRIARELHDEAGQALIGIKLGLQLLAHKVPPEIPGLLEEVDRLRRQVNQSTAQLKGIAHALRPPILDELGLEVALNQCIADFQERMAIAIHFESIDQLTRLPQEIETACYRIVQEALTNVARHAQANQVWIALISDASHVHLSIRDDGQGFDVRQSQRHGLGLLGMQERAKMLGGQIAVKSALNVGTAVTVEIPLGEAK